MRHLAIAAAAASVLVLAACSGETGDAANESANAAAPAGNAAAAAAEEDAAAAADAAPANAAGVAVGDGTLSREYLVGRWTEMDDCAEGATEFRADGTFLFPWGDSGRWSLDGDRLTMSSNTDTLRLRVVDRNTLEISSPSRAYRSVRC
jgi:hypothetical protein